MKNKIFIGLTCISTVLFLGFIGLCAYVWIADFNPKEWPSSDWSSISIGHGSISIVQPSTRTNSPAMTTYLPYGGYDGNIHFTVANGTVKDMSGCRLILFSQSMPFQGVRSFPFSSDDKITGKSGFGGYGMEFGSMTHTTKMIGCSDNDRTSETEFIGYGIFFYDLSHSVDKDKTWWTLMISLWYPIILFGILPAIFAIKKLCNRKSASTKNALNN